MTVANHSGIEAGIYLLMKLCLSLDSIRTCQLCLNIQWQALDYNRKCYDFKKQSLCMFTEWGHFMYNIFPVWEMETLFEVLFLFYNQAANKFYETS